MTAIYNFKVEGLHDVDRKFRKLSKSVQKKVMRRMVRESAKVLRERIRVNTPVDTGALKRGLRVRSVKGAAKRGEIAVGVFTPERAKLGIGVDGGYYPAAIEYGYRHNKSGERIPANPFMRRSAKESEGEIRRVFLSQAGPQIEREAQTG